MRYYRRTDDRTLETRHARVLFFFFGPFYLLWLRLWQEALAMGVGGWLVVHGALALTRNVTGGPAGLELQRAFVLMDSVRAGTAAGAPADAAFRELMAMLLPYYAAGFALLAVMVLLTPVLPRYLTWRLPRRGWLPGRE